MDVLCKRLPPEFAEYITFCRKLKFEEGETDVIYMQHHMKIEFDPVTDQAPEEWKLNLIAMGDAKAKKTAMALTVGTPTAIGAQLILDGVITKPGLLDPTLKEIYDPIMKELDKFNIKFQYEKV